jgi:hypothetical protein
MRLKQAEKPYNPITLTLETRAEAEALFGLVDKIGAWRCHTGTVIDLTPEEISLLIDLSNANTEREIIF